MRSYAYGFPRLGGKREFKYSIEKFWRHECEEEELLRVLSSIQQRNLREYGRYIDDYPRGEMTAYDPMLDIAVMCGFCNVCDLKEYYEYCRGADAFEMTKWFNTNYHYLVPDFTYWKKPNFKENCENKILCFKKCDFPQWIGPFTFLKLSKGLAGARFAEFFMALIEIYGRVLSRYAKAQLDEPAFVLDLTVEEVHLIKQGYQRFRDCGCSITLMTYYESVDFMEDFLSLPVAAVGLDFVRGDNYERLAKLKFPGDKTLIAGLVDGRNVWRNSIGCSLEKLKNLSQKTANLMVSNAAPLYHLPITLSAETRLSPELKGQVAFAREKLEEIQWIADAFSGKQIPGASLKTGAFGVNPHVQERVKSLKASDFVKGVPYDERRAIHQKRLKLPLFPTTTIGSFPQTAEVRQKRAAFKRKEISRIDYRHFLQREIDRLIPFQEDLGLDVFVHGEFERTDMVEFFAKKLLGFETTLEGWIISYGTRTYRPPLLFGDVSRPEPMTLLEILHAQSRTRKPVKGMLTGAVTIIAWSYCREDIPVSEVAYQIALSLRDEIRDYEANGIKIVQVDEAAFREKTPIKKRNWPDYFDWAVKSFNLTVNTDPITQIHTHMCYSHFGEIMQYIMRMDFDVISIEVSRDKGEDILRSFGRADFKRQIGLGVWDIHSPQVPSVAKMEELAKRFLEKIPPENFWLNPDCGLKTRGWDETRQAIFNLVETARTLRDQFKK